MPEKIRYLDGLRGLAAIVVVISHFADAFYPTLRNGLAAQAHMPGNIEVAIAGSPLNLLYNGQFSVSIFFVLSAIVLSYKYFRTRQREAIVSGATRRYIRLFVPVFFSILAAFALLRLSLFYNVAASNFTLSDWWLGSLWRFYPSVGDMLYQSTIGVFLQYGSRWNSVLWTMTYELVGSYIVFTFLALFGAMRNRWIAYLIALGIFGDGYYLAFIAGLAICDLYCNRPAVLKRLGNPAVVALLLLAGLLAGSFPPGISTEGTVYAPFYFSARAPMYFHMAGAALVVVALLSSEWLKRTLSRPVLLYFGRISFSMYLFHLIVICSLSSWFFLAVIPYLPYHLSVLATVALSSVAILAVSTLVEKYVDSNGIKLSKRAYERLFKPTGGPKKEEKAPAIQVAVRGMKP